MDLLAVHRRRGMTLIELLVVISIIGLLAVTTVPLLAGNRTKKAIKNAAQAAESALSHVATKAMTSPQGAAAWLETGTTGAGSYSAVVGIAFARVPAVATGSTAITVTSATAASVTLSLAASIASDLPAPIEFAGVPGLFTATGTATITSGTSSVSGSVNRTNWNSAPPPATATQIPYTIHLPPRQSSFASVTSFANGAAIDLSASQIGPFSAPTMLSNYQRIAIQYDRTGNPAAVWMWSATSGWSRQVLTAATPIVLAIGMWSQAGAAWVPNPTEDDPGASWQDPNALWLLIDPRNGSARAIQAGYSKGAANAAAARTLSLAPIVEEFSNSRQGG
jgi:prepilin-type N-terminal cleavage/methylation domain-containing protein